MKKFIRSYVLIFSNAETNLIIFVVALIIEIATFAIIYGAYVEFGSLPVKIVLLTAFFFIVNTIVCKKIRNRFATIEPSNSDYDSKNIACILLNKEAEKIEFKNAVWGKGRLYVIKSGNKFNYSYRAMELWEKKEFEFQTSLTSRWRNTDVRIPVTITFTLSDEFVAMEIFDALLENSLRKENLSVKARGHKSEEESFKYLYLDDYFEDLFQKINEKNREKLEDECAKFAMKFASGSELLDNVLDFILFPERPFSNIEDVSICLSNPSISACKGVTCKKEIA